MPPYFDKIKGHTVYPEEGLDFASSPQFKGYTGGPEEARIRMWQHEGGYEPPSPEHEVLHQLALGGHGQSHLPGLHPEADVPQEVHHQTPQQFAADPRTWWHGRYTRGGRLSTLSGVGSGPGMETAGEGFHAGTRKAAQERLMAREPHEVWEDHRGHLYPLRITGPVEGPENIHVDTGFHGQLGDARRHGPGYLYENTAEDPESISVGTPRRKGYLSTHREMVWSAQQRGEHVHPLIEWAARMHPEHEGEEWEHPKLPELKRKYPEAFGETGPGSGQMSLFNPKHVQSEQSARRYTFKTESGNYASATKLTGPQFQGLSPSELEHGPMGEVAF